MGNFRDIHRKKPCKVSRRRLMKLFTAAGASTATATTVTADDVRTAASDQVPVAFDLAGESKANVPLDWYERLVDARRAYNKVSENLLGAENIRSVELNPGDLDGENPSVVVGVDENAEKYPRPREQVTALSDDVPVEIEERREPEPIKPELSGPDSKKARAQSDFVDSSPCGDTDTYGHIPGGLEVTFKGARGTLTSRVTDGSNEGWLTNSHVASYENEECGIDLIGAKAKHGGSTIGKVVTVSHDNDFVVIRPSKYYKSPQSKVVLPSDHNTSYDITGTMSKDGFDSFAAAGRDVMKVGTTSCKSSGDPHARGRTVSAKKNDYCKGSFRSAYYNQCSWGSAHNDIRPGDSGSMTFGKDPNGSGYLGMCINISVTGFNRVHGTPGWIIDSKFHYKWG